MEYAPGARRWAAVPLVAGVPLLVVALTLTGTPGLVALVAAVGLMALGPAAIMWFFRDPDREPAGEGVLAPADGHVTVVREEDDRLRVGVFMNVTDVHVNRAPAAGAIKAVEHEPGGHWPAFTKASERNERRRYRIAEDDEADDSQDLGVVQIAGTVARRTHSYVAPGDHIERGERLGHISFGSRVDVLFPPIYVREDLLVAAGDTVRAGETVLARRGDR